jgi:hypothetical protein
MAGWDIEQQTSASCCVSSLRAGELVSRVRQVTDVSFTGKLGWDLAEQSAAVRKRVEGSRFKPQQWQCVKFPF